MSEIPKANIDNFDWVTARSQCSLRMVYERLKLDVKDYIQKRNALIPSQADYSFQFVPGGGNSFTVLIGGFPKVQESVTFQLSEKCIEVQKQDAPMFDATVGLNNDGECVMRINGQDYRPWQAAKLALERLFFEIV
jgi:hypothetical protein